jgi:hypothetical protein
VSRPAAAWPGVAALCGHPRLAHADALGQFPLGQARFLAQRGQPRRQPQLVFDRRDPAGGSGRAQDLCCQRGLMLVEQVVGDQVREAFRIW